MNPANGLLWRCFAYGGIALLAACTGAGDGHEHEHSHDEETAAEFERGPHGGRMLRDGNFGLEVALLEEGIAPQFRVYVYEGGEPVTPGDVSITMQLTRLGGAVETHRFEARDDFLSGDDLVDEPHSFDVKVSASRAGAQHEWTYASYEARTQIPADIAQAHGIEVATVASGRLQETITLYGAVQLDPQRVRTVSARFPGTVRAVNRQVGDTVRAGDALASIESDESLQVYTVAAPIGGTITRRHVNPGEAAGREPLFEIADLDRLRVELDVFARDRGSLRSGQPVRVEATDGEGRADGVVDYVSPVGTQQQTSSARVLLDNRDGRWTPGQFVNALVTIATREAAMVIPVSALQTFRDRNAAFLAVGDTYEARPLELGRNDGSFVEVIAGLRAGDRVVAENSYLVKADIEKSGASHDH